MHINLYIYIYTCIYVYTWCMRGGITGTANDRRSCINASAIDGASRCSPRASPVSIHSRISRTCTSSPEATNGRWSRPPKANRSYNAPVSLQISFGSKMPVRKRRS